MNARVIIVCSLLALALPAFAEDYPEKNGWWFNNFEDPSLPWDVYRDAFIGTPPADDPVVWPFDSLFYNQVFKSELSKEGNCYGMSLMTLEMISKGGHLGYCMPVSQYSGDLVHTGADALGPDDPGLKRAINIMHGHQVNLPTLEYLLQIIAQANNRNGAFAYQTLLDSQMRKDLTLVSITKGLSPSDGGHTLVAYKAEDLGGGNRRIYVYDPNRTWGIDDADNRQWYVNAQNFIAINGNGWSFPMAGSTPETWTGDPGSGGNIVIVPLSVTGPHSRTPASLGDQIVGKILNQLFLTGQSAAVTQVTDARGKRLFKPGTFEIDTDPSTGMRTMLPWYRSDASDGGRSDRAAFFLLGPSAGRLQVEVQAGESGYGLRLVGQGSEVAVTAHGGRGVDLVSIERLATGEPRVALVNGRGTDAYDVAFTDAVRPNERLHVLTSRNLRIPDQARAEVGVGDKHQALVVQSSTTSLSYDLELVRVTRDGRQTLARRGFVQDPGTSHAVRPRSWANLSERDVLERLSPRPIERR